MNAHVAAAYAEYEMLREVQRSEIVGITLDGWVVRHIVTVLDFNKPPCAPRAEDAALEPESLPVPRKYQVLHDIIQGQKAERAEIMLDEVQACLTEHGPMPAAHIAERIGKAGAINRVLNTLRAHPEIFVYCGGQFRAWRLHTQSFEKPKLRKPDTPTMLAVRATLAEHGPQTMAEIAKRIDAHPPVVRNVFLRRPEWFRIVGIRKGTGNVPDSNIWGLT